MNVNDMHPSRWLKAVDLKSKTHELVMDRVEMVELNSERGTETKPALYFMGAKKGLILNTINTNTIAGLYGMETGAWSGQKITLFPTMVEFGRKIVEAIRVRDPNAPMPEMPAPAQQTQTLATAASEMTDPVNRAAMEAQGSTGLDDDVPF